MESTNYVESNHPKNDDFGPSLRHGCREVALRCGSLFAPDTLCYRDRSAAPTSRLPTALLRYIYLSTKNTWHRDRSSARRAAFLFSIKNRK